MKRFLSDGIITDSESKRIEELGKALEIKRTQQESLIYGVKCDVYSDNLTAVLNERLMDDNVERLIAMQRNFNLSPEDVQNISEKKGAARYRLELNNIGNEIINGTPIDIIADSRVNTVVRITCMSQLNQSKHMKSVGIALYKSLFQSAISTGNISLEAEQRLDAIRQYYKLSEWDIAKQLHEIKRIKHIVRCKNGDLPSITTDRLLEGGEICHWDHRCTYVRPRRRRQKGMDYIEDESIKGRLTVTSQRIIFSSDITSFEFRPSKIIKVLLFSGVLPGEGVIIETSSNKGGGKYLIKDADEFEAIMYGLVQSHKYQLAKDPDAANSRHIPDIVRREVWTRDGGRCVQCRATDYLEYDHIIPFSKGGANTVGNVQLLCRRCNLEKSNRI